MSTPEPATVGDALLIDFICAVALCGPHTPLRRLARLVGLSVHAVQQIIDTHRIEFIARHSANRYFWEIYNPYRARLCAPPEEFIRLLLEDRECAAACMHWPYSMMQGLPSYRGRHICWLMLERDNPEIDSEYRQTHRIVHSCDDKTCVNRGHFYAVPKSTQETLARYEPKADPLLKAWR